MFDKYKARWAKLEEDHEAVRKVRLHVEKHKNTYLVGAGCLGAGYLLHRPQVITVINEIAAPVVPQVINNNHNIGNVVNTAVNNGGYVRKIIRCVETDEMWPSMTKAAESAGHSLRSMSNQIHGHTEHLDGLHYVIEGLTAS